MSKARDLANAGTALGAVTATELGYLDGVTSAVQTQIDAKIGSASAINPTIVDAKGDIITATAADTPARLAVGNSGDTLVADSGTATGLRYKEDYAAGKNKIINGDFGVWQRGTSFSNPATAAFTSDRWSVVYDGTGATRTISQQTFTPGTAPVAGYEGGFFYRFAQSVAGSGGSYNLFQNRMEDVRTFAGQTVTISFWGKAAATTSIVKLNLEQNFGSGGSPSGDVSTDIAATNFSLTTSWQRFTVTTTVPSISGKTIGTTTSGYLGLRFWIPINSTFTLDFWGVQVEESSVATAFQTATGTIAGEIYACERYFQKNYDLNENPGTTSSNAVVWTQIEGSETSRVLMNWRFQTRMRTAPTMVFYSTSTGSSGKVFNRSANADRNITSYSAGQTGITYNTIDGTNSAGQQILVLYTASAEL